MVCLCVSDSTVISIYVCVFSFMDNFLYICVYMYLIFIVWCVMNIEDYLYTTFHFVYHFIIESTLCIKLSKICQRLRILYSTDS